MTKKPNESVDQPESPEPHDDEDVYAPGEYGFEDNDFDDDDDLYDEFDDWEGDDWDDDDFDDDDI